MNVQFKKAMPLMLVAVLAILLFTIRQCKDRQVAKSKTTVTKESKKNDTKTDRDKGFDRRISYLEYSNHAKCRMQCRNISASEVEQIMQEGKINYNKSNIQSTRCPEYALEGTTGDIQKVRIVFGQCNNKTV